MPQSENRKRFFNNEPFGGGWTFHQGTAGVGMIIDDHGSLFLVSFISNSFFIARGWYKGKQRMKVTVDFKNLKFDKDGTTRIRNRNL